MVGAGEVQKKYSRKGKLNEKNSGAPINTKTIFMPWPKTNSYKEIDKEKKIPAVRKFPSPHNFFNGRSLKEVLGLLPYAGNTFIPNISS